jgi:hypothetical protein
VNSTRFTLKAPRLAIPLLLVLLLASSVRCGESPTQPDVRSPTPTARPLDLNGEWSGTFENFHCTAPAQVSARLSHQGYTVAGSLTFRCSSGPGFPGSGGSDYLYLRGSFLGSSRIVRVELLWSDQWICTLFGEVSSTKVALSNPYRSGASSRSSNLCPGAKLTLSR